MKTLLFSAFAFLAFALSSQAQTTAAHTVNVVIPQILSITLASTADVTISFATIGELTTGKNTEATPSVLQVTSNQGYAVSVQASQPLTRAGGGEIPYTAWQVKADGSYQNLSGAPLSLFNSGVGGNSISQNVAYQVTPGLTNASGTYTAQVTYTVTQQ